MFLSIDTKKPLPRLREDLEKACAAHAFGVLGVIDLQSKMKEKGLEYGKPCLVFEVCNPKQAKRALEANPEVSTALPCRIAVFESKDGKTRLSTIRPTKIMSMMDGGPELAAVAREVEQTLDEILHDAVR